jgi:DNA-binding NarL/FixJ family response regulator
MPEDNPLLGKSVYSLARPDRDEPVMVAIGAFAPLVHHGLRHILGEDRGLRVVGFNLDPAALEAVVARHAAEVVILDEASALEPYMLERAPAGRLEIGVLVLAHQPTRAYCLRVLALGARACISKNSSAAEIVSAVRLAALGEHLLASPSDRPASGDQFVGLLLLTSRERAVLKLLGVGQSNAQIALELQIAVETARTHVAHIYRKLGVSARRELIGIDLPKQDARKR